MDPTGSPARPSDCIGDTPLEDIGPSGDRATAGDRCCRSPPQSIGGGAASSAVQQMKYKSVSVSAISDSSSGGGRAKPVFCKDAHQRVWACAISGSRAVQIGTMYI